MLTKDVTSVCHLVCLSVGDFPLFFLDYISTIVSRSKATDPSTSRFVNVPGHFFRSSKTLIISTTSNPYTAQAASILIMSPTGVYSLRPMSRFKQVLRVGLMLAGVASGSVVRQTAISSNTIVPFTPSDDSFSRLSHIEIPPPTSCEVKTTTTTLTVTVTTVSSVSMALKDSATTSTNLGSKLQSSVVAETQSSTSHNCTHSVAFLLNATSLVSVTMPSTISTTGHASAGTIATPVGSAAMQQSCAQIPTNKTAMQPYFGLNVVNTKPYANGAPVFKTSED